MLLPGKHNVVVGVGRPGVEGDTAQGSQSPPGGVLECHEVVTALRLVRYREPY